MKDLVSLPIVTSKFLHGGWIPYLGLITHDSKSDQSRDTTIAAADSFIPIARTFTLYLFTSHFVQSLTTEWTFQIQLNCENTCYLRRWVDEKHQNITKHLTNLTELSYKIHSVLLQPNN